MMFHFCSHLMFQKCSKVIFALFEKILPKNLFYNGYRYSELFYYLVTSFGLF